MLIKEGKKEKKKRKEKRQERRQKRYNGRDMTEEILENALVVMTPSVSVKQCRSDRGAEMVAGGSCSCFWVFCDSYLAIIISLYQDQKKKKKEKMESCPRRSRCCKWTRSITTSFLCKLGWACAV
jgi:hypothetical protein